MVLRGQKGWGQMRLPHHMKILIHWPVDCESHPKNGSTLWIVLSVLPIFLRMEHRNQYTDSSMVMLVSKTYVGVGVILCRLLCLGQVVITASMFLGSSSTLNSDLSVPRKLKPVKGIHSILFYFKLAKNYIILIFTSTLHYTNNCTNTGKGELIHITAQIITPISFLLLLGCIIFKGKLNHCFFLLLTKYLLLCANTYVCNERCVLCKSVSVCPVIVFSVRHGSLCMCT